MFGKQRFVRASLIATFMLILSVAVASAQTRPTIFAVDQNVVDGIVEIARVSSDGPAWIAIQADDNGAPGELLGSVPFEGGLGATIPVSIAPYQPAAGEVLHATLYADDGSGALDVATATPLEYNGAPVTDDITVLDSGFSLASVIAENDLDVFAGIAESTGLTGDLAEGGPYTVFAPSSAAIAATTLPEGEEAQGALVQGLIVPGVFATSAFTESQVLNSLAGTEIAVDVADDGTVTVNGFAISQPDIEAFNGVIHVIDGVILPPAPEEEAAAEEEPAVEATAEVTETVAVTSTETVTATEVVTTEATPEPTEEAAEEEATADATPEATEEPAEEAAAAEATEEPAEEAAAAEATEESAEEAAAAEATAEPAEEAAATEAAPEELPATGAPASPVMPMLVAGLVLFALALFAVVFRRKAA